jgi:hypothetical protein
MSGFETLEYKIRKYNYKAQHAGSRKDAKVYLDRANKYKRMMYKQRGGVVTPDEINTMLTAQGAALTKAAKFGVARDYIVSELQKVDTYDNALNILQLIADGDINTKDKFDAAIANPAGQKKAPKPAAVPVQPAAAAPAPAAAVALPTVTDIPDAPPTDEEEQEKKKQEALAALESKRTELPANEADIPPFIEALKRQRDSLLNRLKLDATGTDMGKLKQSVDDLSTRIKTLSSTNTVNIQAAEALWEHSEDMRNKINEKIKDIGKQGNAEMQQLLDTQVEQLSKINEEVGNLLKNWIVKEATVIEEIEDIMNRMLAADDPNTVLDELNTAIGKFMALNPKEGGKNLLNDIIEKHGENLLKSGKPNAEKAAQGIKKELIK